MTSGSRRAVAIVLAIAGSVVATLLLRPTPQRLAAGEIVGSIESSATLKLFEGLPHRLFQSELFKNELASKEVTQLEGHPFYASSVWVAPGVEDQLREIARSPNSYQEFGGEKKCGGFHADFAMIWGNENACSTILVCFGCNEAWLFGKDLSVRVDMATRAAKVLQETLEKCRKHRPIAESN